MAIISSRSADRLAAPTVLAPERYDPRRELSSKVSSAPLNEIVEIVKQTVQTKDAIKPALVLDTSDAREGFVIARKQPTTDIGSTKKTTQPGDVIISRLRPYLRQVALVDEAIPNSSNAQILCSTEFFVLRSINRESIAFLVPFLLTESVQQVLAASQEGGHHPRFDSTVLLALPIPTAMLDVRQDVSTRVERAAKLYREAELTIDDYIEQASQLIKGR